jgi:hypothetical protein
VSRAFGRLSPAVQYQVVNGLGFSGLRPVQEQTIDAILDDQNCVVLAPTAGGKTEAAFFPLLSRMDAEDWKPVSVIYVAPIRALLNNQEERLARYAGLIGRRAFKWHGDVGAADKRGFVSEPADILLTTPESLEVMLMSRKVPAERLFRGLQAVVIDEIHAFVGDDRGGHLSAVLERLSRFCGRDVQRIGLSATVGNPADILRWVAGSSQRAGVVVDPGGAKKPPDIAIDWVANADNAAKLIAQLHPGKKRLVFVDSRRGVESLGEKLRAAGVDAYVTHSSLAEERQAAEQAFQEGQNCVIVATSVLARHRRRRPRPRDPDRRADERRRISSDGRTGRREGKNPNCTFATETTAPCRPSRSSGCSGAGSSSRSRCGARRTSLRTARARRAARGRRPGRRLVACVKRHVPGARRHRPPRARRAHTAVGIPVESGAATRSRARRDSTAGATSPALCRVLRAAAPQGDLGRHRDRSIDVTFAQEKLEQLSCAAPARGAPSRSTGAGLVRVEPIAEQARALAAAGAARPRPVWAMREVPPRRLRARVVQACSSD